MRVLIAGCGYVGTALGAELVRQGHEVFGVRRTGEANDELRAVSIQPVVADLSNVRTFSKLPQGCGWIVYCASASGGGAEEYRRIYLEGLRQVVEWAAPQRPEKLVYTSSTGVYGQDDGSAVDEEAACEPAAETAKVLVQAEESLMALGRQRGVPVVILRLAGIYGPGRGYWLRQFLAGEARLEGEGNRWLNMIHQEDAVGAIVAALERGGSGRVYNVVDDEPVQQLALFQWLAEKLGRSLPATSDSGPGLDLGSTARGLRRAASSKVVLNRRLRRELGYQLRYPTFREGFSAELERLKSP